MATTTHNNISQACISSSPSSAPTVACGRTARMRSSGERASARPRRCRSARSEDAIAMLTAPHSSLDYRSPDPEAILLPASGLPYAPLRPVQMLAEHGRVLT